MLTGRNSFMQQEKSTCWPHMKYVAEEKWRQFLNDGHFLATSPKPFFKVIQELQKAADTVIITTPKYNRRQVLHFRSKLLQSDNLTLSQFDMFCNWNAPSFDAFYDFCLQSLVSSSALYVNSSITLSKCSSSSK